MTRPGAAGSERLGSWVVENDRHLKKAQDAQGINHPHDHTPHHSERGEAPWAKSCHAHRAKESGQNAEEVGQGGAHHGDPPQPQRDVIRRETAHAPVQRTRRVGRGPADGAH